MFLTSFITLRAGFTAVSKVGKILKIPWEVNMAFLMSPEDMSLGFFP